MEGWSHTHTMEFSNYKEKQGFVVYRKMGATGGNPIKQQIKLEKDKHHMNSPIYGSKI